MIYYAHHLWKYNTEIEEYEVDLITKYFPHDNIINPNGFVEQNREESDIMKDCLTCIENCDILVFSSVNGIIGKGVYDEFNKAKQLWLRIYYIYDDILNDATNYEFRLLYKNDNRQYAIVIKS